MDSEHTRAQVHVCNLQAQHLADPHTAVALAVAEKDARDPATPMVVVATAHPAKFPDAVEQATGIRPALPPHLADLMDRPEYFTVMPNDLQKVTAFIRSVNA